MSKVLSGKKILLIAPVFFEYEKHIIQNIEECGGAVIFLPDRPFTNSLLKGLFRFSRTFFMPFLNLYYIITLSKINANIDIVFVINGEGLSRNTLGWMRKYFHKATFCYYLWDSLYNKNYPLSFLDFFDRKFTFDIKDSKNNHIDFKPLFYLRKRTNPIEKCIYDSCFIGTAHGDRYFIIQRLLTQYSKYNFFVYLYLQKKWLYYFYKLFNNNYKSARISQFNFNPLKTHEIEKIIDLSKSVIDVQHNSQTGLTVRTIESLAAEKKLITTNVNIVYTDLYNDNNVMIVDREINLDEFNKFIDTPFLQYDESIINKYSLKNWILSIIA